MIEDLPGEEWRDIPGYEGIYQVSSHGRVKTIAGRYRKSMIRTRNVMKSGYCLISLYRDGKEKGHLVHRLVMQAFKPIDDPASMQVNHIDLDKENCRLDNLEWCSGPQNMKHFRDSENWESYAEKLWVPSVKMAGSAHHLSRLTDADVIEIRRLCAEGGYGIKTKVARKYGISPNTVQQIVKGISWKHLLPKGKDEPTP